MIGDAPAGQQFDSAEVVPFDVASIAPAAMPPPSSNGPVLLANVTVESFERMPTGITPLDAVLGGGIVAGSLLILSGEAGAGKSSLVKQAMAGLGERVLYATGEETVAQVAERARRIGVADAKIYIVHETDLEVVLQHARQVRAAVIVIDSIQTMRCREVANEPGTPTQVRACASRLMDFAKQTDVAIWMIGHVTSDGSLAGPTFLKHMVDVVMEMESGRGAVRILRCGGGKNRFGRATVVGKFEMTDDGLVPISYSDSSEAQDDAE